jgi:putative membrane protein
MWRELFCEKMMGYYGFGFIEWIFMVLFWAAVIFLIISLLRRHRFSERNFEDNYGTRRTPHEILKERYAKGEITKKEYEEMKKDIM